MGLCFLFSILFLLTDARSVHSANLFKPFGIEVKKLKANPIELKEQEGYTCIVPGQTIEGKPIGSPVGTPTSYFIPAGLIGKGGTQPKVGKQLIGTYSIKTPIVCVRIKPPSVSTVNIDTVAQQWGTTKL